MVFFHAHFGDYFSDEFVYYTVGATGTIVHVVAVKEFWFLVNQILGFYDIFSCHGISFSDL